MTIILTTNICYPILSLRQKSATFATSLVRERLAAIFSLSKDDNHTTNYISGTMWASYPTYFVILSKAYLVRGGAGVRGTPLTKSKAPTEPTGEKVCEADRGIE